MSKRPLIKGRGADIYLGDDSERSPGFREADSERVSVSDKPDPQKVFESSTKPGESLFGLDSVKKAAAWYIETTEKLANQAIELQEKTTSWAKRTPLGPLFEAQTSIARKFVARSASAARNLWQVHSQQRV